MANVKITALPSLTGAASDSLDVIPVVDISTDTTSKMTRAEFFKNVPAVSVVGAITSSSIITDGFIAHANGTLALAFGTDGVCRVTPTATGSFTSTVPAAGTRSTLIVLTSGTTSYTMTFGTGFKSTGTLATGTVNARYFVFQFISDGTSLIECSRTTAIT